jgi:hypothetical protein
MPVLNGPWYLACDPANCGRSEGWYATDVLPDARPASVPGIIQQTYPGYHGVVWYACEFTPGSLPTSDGRYLLRFWVVDYLAEVWVNGIPVGGHEGGETPFVLDITDACRPGVVNRLTVRVLNPVHVPIDGIVLNETPHRNKYLPFSNGGSWNYGGITEPVELQAVPALHVAGLFVQPDWQTGRVRVQVDLRNTAAAIYPVRLRLSITPATSGEALVACELPCAVHTGDSTVEAELLVPAHRLWDLGTPYLYRLNARACSPSEAASNTPCDEAAVRFGFRDFRIVDGYFRLNGRRIFVRSTHTGNHSPEGQILPPASAPDLLRRDLIYAKASGFNMVRYIAGVAHPDQLDLCDELGLLVYEETLAGWLLADSSKMPERFDRSIREMILRDRNHPSVVIWGLLNETPDGPVFRQAVAAPRLVRELDPTRLLLLGSGRWDCQLGIGSACNPGCSEWEHVWGAERPGAAPAPYSWKLGYPGGYFERVGDAHVYPGAPHSAETIRFLRTLGAGTKPVFLSEYGIGSVMNVLRELRVYEHRRINPEAEDALLMRSMAERFLADWARYGMDGVYAFPEDMLRESQRLHARQRLLGFDAIRANPQICGFNLTGMLDHGMTGEGLWTFWREWKPGIVDALADGWAPARWCLFADPMHGYLGRPVTLEAILANEDDWPAGDYPVCLRVVGPAGVAWEHRTTLSIPQAAPGHDGPLAMPVFRGQVTLDGPAGVYEFAAYMEQGGAPAGGRLKFRLADPNAARADLPARLPTVALWGVAERVRDWLADLGIPCHSFAAPAREQKGREVILVGDFSDTAGGLATDDWEELARRMAQGSTVVFLAPSALQRDNDPVGWLPLPAGHKGRAYEFNDWLYHKECVARAHPVFAGLAGPGILDWDYYGPLISRTIFDGQDTPDETMAAAFALGYPCPGGYASGLVMAAYRFGAGRFVLNTLKILENLGAHPAADRLLVNLIAYAAAETATPPAALPVNFSNTLAAVGYG